MAIRQSSLVITIACVVCACILLIIIYRFEVSNERFTNDGTVSYYRVNNRLVTGAKSLPLMGIFKEALEVSNMGVKQGSFNTAAFLQFETLNTIDTDMLRFKFPTSVKYIYGLVGSDLLAGKQALYVTLKTKLGEEIATSYVPKSYITSNSSDLESLKREFDPSKVYIMKKNIQRQQGQHITNKLDDVISRFHDYVIVQEVLQNPFLVGGRKINIRIYLLIKLSDQGTPEFYIYNDGFMYYTPNVFRANSLDTDDVITTGYIDRKVYQENPLTLSDLYTSIGHDNAATLKSNIRSLFEVIKHCYSTDVQSLNSSIHGTKFLIYGCDVAPDTKLNCKLMEINKGPDLSYKDERDKAVKLGMVLDALSICGMTKQHKSHNFTLI